MGKVGRRHVGRSDRHDPRCVFRNGSGDSNVLCGPKSARAVVELAMRIARRDAPLLPLVMPGRSDRHDPRCVFRNGSGDSNVLCGPKSARAVVELAMRIARRDAPHLPLVMPGRSDRHDPRCVFRKGGGDSNVLCRPICARAVVGLAMRIACRDVPRLPMFTLGRSDRP